MPSSFFNSKPYKFGLTLSGGGSKCMAQIGMLQYLDEQGVKPDVISGASGGALVGALYAAGHSPEKILTFFVESQMFKVSSFSFNKLGLINSEKLHSHFHGWIKRDNFDALDIPLFVATTDLNAAQQVVIKEGELIQALLASAAYPGMFTPVKIGDKLFADGGITNNYPTDLIHGLCRAHLGMYLSPLEHKANHEFSDAFDILDRVFEIYSSTHLLKSIKLPDISLSPEGIDRWGAFNVNNDSLKTLYTLGYETTRDYFETEGAEWLEQVKKSLAKRSLFESLTG
ncbi:patatin-like phospholipase family protein [Photobacterium sp. ZSDE20]|uniref:Patatin-like phospholipase family protein n=1 Tax=Photobacterium pectinilyticum TaxID=2906793 RepID=A0ABT1N8R9_9GAMM|nr:patatin-like phospholipase family protein [Photobacterium sp. ZSDE20]MCQ1061135.1 patatin-like phospholipase family protein [Photobacterium sp. ZSDE20]MDD1829400.1 patatin-like phospholipase family protein [Photobacterium sp. ZSDE20]